MVEENSGSQENENKTGSAINLKSRDTGTQDKYDKPTDEKKNEIATDKQGYVQYNSPASSQGSDQLYGEKELFTIGAGVMGGAYDDGEGGCNTSFDFFFNIDWNLPDFNFFGAPAEFDTSLFDKADQISLEVAMINDMLINAILDMNCCDIARVYNITMVPFFRFFADHPSITECGETAKPGDKCAWGGGQNLISMLILYAEIITMLRAVVEPLDCLVKPLPGNPWKKKDTDPLAWIYGYFKEAKPVLDKFLSGELLDIILNPIHKLRVKLQACLATGGKEGSDLFNIFDVGNSQQLEKVSKQAVKDGKKIEDAVLPKPEEPKEPKPEDYEKGKEDPQYKEAMRLYEKAKKKYEIDKKKYEELKEEVKRQSKAQKEVTPSLAKDAQTKALVKVHTDGICGCVASALGLNDITLIPFPVRTTKDICRLEGNTINGVTNKDAGVQSKDRPKDEKYTVQQGDCKKKSAKEAIVKSGSSKGSGTKTEVKEEKKEIPNPYKEIGKSGGDTENVEVKQAEVNKSGGDQVERLKNNDEKEKQIKSLSEYLDGLANHFHELQTATEELWKLDRKETLKIINSQSQLKEKINRISKTASSKDDEELYREFEILLDMDIQYAGNIFDSYFRTFIPFDFRNDPYDQEAISKYIPEIYTPDSLADKINKQREKVSTLYFKSLGLGKEIIPFPPNTPPQNIINRLPVSTEVEVDERFEVNYFNAGFVREKGSRSWRDFNPLELAWGEFARENGAIGPDRTDMYYIAIFPNDTIGLQASINYIRHNFNYQTLEFCISNLLKNKDPIHLDYFFNKLETEYFFDKTKEINEFTDEELEIIINLVKEDNGFKEGKLWVKMRKVDSRYEFTSNDEPDLMIVEENEEIKYVKNRSVIMTTSEFISNYLIKQASATEQVAKKVNESIEKRGEKYKEAAKTEKKTQEGQKAKDDIYQALMNDIASIVNTEYDLLIPCTCDNFLCQLLNQIIQYALAALNKLIQAIIDAIMKFLIPDWLKDLMKLIQDMMACFNQIFGIFATIMAIHQYAQDLLESLKWRISLYPADPCFIPDNPFEESSSGSGSFDWSSYSGSGWPDEGSESGYPRLSRSGSGYYPPGPWRPPVDPGGGHPIPGHNGPGFGYYCEYIYI